MSWKLRMYTGIGQYLREEKGLDVLEVIDIDEDASAYSGFGGCETCGPDYDVDFEVKITYKDRFGKTQVYRYDGTFVDFINGIA